MTENELNTLLPLLKKRIPYDEDFFADEPEWNEALTRLLEDSRDALLSRLYPFEDYSSYAIPAHKYNWILRCSVELYNIADKMGVTSYAENGLSWAKYTDGLSKSLTCELISHVGIPKYTPIEENGD